MDKLLVTFAGALAIAGTYWFFLGKRETRAVRSEGGQMRITVEGGYKPDVVAVPKGTRTTLIFLRKDPSSCLEEVVISEFKIRKYLPLGEEVKIDIAPQTAGEFPFTCGMGMFHGKIIVGE